MKILYEVIEHQNIDDSVKKIFGLMLQKQGKVQGDFATKAGRCKLTCFVKADDDDVVAIGAIKQKTKSDFTSDKADLGRLEKEFEWELGYFYTESNYLGRGIALNISRVLIEEYGSDNLMASTEITNNPAMVKILEKNGFRLLGKPWESAIHNHYLGLFLKFQ